MSQKIQGGNSNRGKKDKTSSEPENNINGSVAARGGVPPFSNNNSSETTQNAIVGDGNSTSTNLNNEINKTGNVTPTNDIEESQNKKEGIEGQNGDDSDESPIMSKSPSFDLDDLIRGHDDTSKPDIGKSKTTKQEHSTIPVPDAPAAVAVTAKAPNAVPVQGATKAIPPNPSKQPPTPSKSTPPPVITGPTANNSSVVADAPAVEVLEDESDIEETVDNRQASVEDLSWVNGQLKGFSIGNQKRIEAEGFKKINEGMTKQGKELVTRIINVCKACGFVPDKNALTEVSKKSFPRSNTSGSQKLCVSIGKKADASALMLFVFSSCDAAIPGECTHAYSVMSSLGQTATVEKPSEYWLTLMASWSVCIFPSAMFASLPKINTNVESVVNTVQFPGDLHVKNHRTSKKAAKFVDVTMNVVDSVMDVGMAYVDTNAEQKCIRNGIITTNSVFNTLNNSSLRGKLIAFSMAVGSNDCDLDLAKAAITAADKDTVERQAVVASRLGQTTAVAHAGPTKLEIRSSGSDGPVIYSAVFDSKMVMLHSSTHANAAMDALGVQMSETLRRPVRTKGSILAELHHDLKKFGDYGYVGIKMASEWMWQWICSQGDAPIASIIEVVLIVMTTFDITAAAVPLSYILFKGSSSKVWFNPERKNHFAITNDTIAATALIAKLGILDEGDYYSFISERLRGKLTWSSTPSTAQNLIPNLMAKNPFAVTANFRVANMKLAECIASTRVQRPIVTNIPIPASYIFKTKDELAGLVGKEVEGAVIVPANGAVAAVDQVRSSIAVESWKQSKMVVGSLAFVNVGVDTNSITMRQSSSTWSNVANFLAENGTLAPSAGSISGASSKVETKKNTPSAEAGIGAEF